MKSVGDVQRKPKKWADGHGRDVNYAVQTYRKAKKAEKEKKMAESDRFNSLCSEVVVTKIEPTMSHLLEARLERQNKKSSRFNLTNPRALGTNPRSIGV